ncbi:unnamed protein product [Ilex paraguariensis]|uniref:FLZ-type domain-containing protein n=1 Tax=Ilex paraguariensis TaxID=185542 RepID=A0ABC8SEB0_9AQUA
MFCKNSRPVIEKLTGKLVSGSWVKLRDGTISPRSPLEFKIQSPRGVKNLNYDVGGVGLGIVAALDKSDENGNKIQVTKKAALCSLNLNRSKPIPVVSARHRGGSEEMDMDDGLEDYTFVTCHGPNKSHTRVYCDGGEYRGRQHKIEPVTTDQRRSTSVRACVFDISPARFGDVPAYPASDFLSSCHLCQKKLHGKDIYIYRGEKAFCSTECRYKQIVMDERKKQCSSEASRSADVSNSPYTNGQMFSTGILAI